LACLGIVAFCDGAGVVQAEIDNQRSQAFRPSGWIADLCVKGESSMAKPSKKSAKAKPAAQKLVKPVVKPKAAVKVAPPKTVPLKAVQSKSATKGPTAAENNRFTLYGFAGSTNTYTAALMLSLCRHPFSYIHVSLRDGAHKQPDYLVKNRFGQVPALRDGQSYYVQSASILLHLAESLGKFDGKTPLERGRIREWLFWQWDKLALPVFRLRARNKGVRQFGDEVRVMYDTEAKAALAVMEQDLLKNEWIAGKKPTAADIGIYSVVRFCGDANVDVNNYPAVTRWKQRMEALPGFATPEQLLPMESRLV
jgi:glutathione S-transferase